MRISADSRSEHYKGDGVAYHVWIDGKRVDRVVEVDDKAGWVIRDQTDTNGHVRIDRAEQCTLREILRGRVTIINPALLPVPVPRKLVVLVMEGCDLSKRIEWCRLNGDIAEVVVVTPELKGWEPQAMWIDDLQELVDGAAQRVVEQVTREFLWGTGEPMNVPRGLVAFTEQQAVTVTENGRKLPHSEVVARSQDRPWLKSRKGRRAP